MNQLGKVGDGGVSAETTATINAPDGFISVNSETSGKYTQHKADAHATTVNAPSFTKNDSAVLNQPHYKNSHQTSIPQMSGMQVPVSVLETVVAERDLLRVQNEQLWTIIERQRTIMTNLQAQLNATGSNTQLPDPSFATLTIPTSLAGVSSQPMDTVFATTINDGHSNAANMLDAVLLHKLPLTPFKDIPIADASESTAPLAISMSSVIPDETTKPQIPHATANLHSNDVLVPTTNPRHSLSNMAGSSDRAAPDFLAESDTVTRSEHELSVVQSKPNAVECGSRTSSLPRGAKSSTPSLSTTVSAAYFSKSGQPLSDEMNADYGSSTTSAISSANRPRSNTSPSIIGIPVQSTDFESEAVLSNRFISGMGSGNTSVQSSSERPSNKNLKATPRSASSSNIGSVDGGMAPVNTFSSNNQASNSTNAFGMSVGGAVQNPKSTSVPDLSSNSIGPSENSGQMPTRIYDPKEMGSIDFDDHHITTSDRRIDKFTSLSNITIQVVCSKIHVSVRGREVVTFIILVSDTLAGSQWYIGKLYADFITLETKLKNNQSRSMVMSIGKAPEKPVFSPLAPASKEDQRCMVIEMYLSHLKSLCSEHPDFVEFLCTNIVDSPIADKRLIQKYLKAGSLYKKGKSFGGWKSRFFLIDPSGVNLCYSESKDREQIGTINLRYCYVSRSVPNEMDRFGLVLGEYKKAMFSPDSAPPSIGPDGLPDAKLECKHLLFADSEYERDDWVLCLSGQILIMRPDDQLTARELRSMNVLLPFRDPLKNMIPNSAIPARQHSNNGLVGPSSSTYEATKLASLRANPQNPQLLVDQSHLHQQFLQSNLPNNFDPSSGYAVNGMLADSFQSSTGIAKSQHAARQTSTPRNLESHQAYIPPHMGSGLSENVAGTHPNAPNNFISGTSALSLHNGVLTQPLPPTSDDFANSSEFKPHAPFIERLPVVNLPETVIPPRNDLNQKPNSSAQSELQASGTGAQLLHTPGPPLPAKSHDLKPYRSTPLGLGVNRRVSKMSPFMGVPNTGHLNKSLSPASPVASEPTTSLPRGANTFTDENQRIMQQPWPKTLVEDSPALLAQQQRGPVIKEKKKPANIFKDWVKKKSHGQEVGKTTRPVFGFSLQEAIAAYKIHEGLELPSIVFRCIEYLDARNAYEEEGLYRLSGSSTVIQNLKHRFDTEGDVNLLEEVETYSDVHAIAGVLKLFFRELTEPILTKELRNNFFQLIDCADRSTRVTELTRLISMLPIANYTLLKVVLGHLIRVVQRSEVNKMSVKNINIVFSPTLGIPANILILMMAEYQNIFSWSLNDPERGHNLPSSSTDSAPIQSNKSLPEQQSFSISEPKPIIEHSETASDYQKPRHSTHHRTDSRSEPLEPPVLNQVSTKESESNPLVSNRYSMASPFMHHSSRQPHPSSGTPTSQHQTGGIPRESTHALPILLPRRKASSAEAQEMLKHSTDSNMDVPYQGLYSKRQPNLSAPNIQQDASTSPFKPPLETLVPVTTPTRNQSLVGPLTNANVSLSPPIGMIYPKTTPAHPSVTEIQESSNAMGFVEPPWQNQPHLMPGESNTSNFKPASYFLENSRTSTTSFHSASDPMVALQLQLNGISDYTTQTPDSEKRETKYIDDMESLPPSELRQILEWAQPTHPK
ncbi:Rho GTPase activating protein [Batrachochytrium dendrobatidis]|nr:Rho GTPase activating protein [Batrachochytrium dendrobatidis]KAK5671940.1 Rho GTPase activating protein [Batrachochytrium dendrobatidis]